MLLGPDRHRRPSTSSSDWAPRCRCPPTSGRSWPSSAGLLMGAHLAVRPLAPEADPTLLPLAALLNGLGYVFIARLDEDLAANQATWTMLGIGVFAVTLLVCGDLDVLKPVPLHARLRRARPDRAPPRPRGREDPERRPPVGEPGAGELPARRVRQGRAAPLFSPPTSSTPASCWRSARRRLRSVPPPRSPLTSPPSLVAWARFAGVLIFQKDLGSFAPAVHDVRRDAVDGHRAGVVPRPRCPCCSPPGRSRRGPRFDHVRQRVDVWLDPWADPDGSGFQLLQAYVRAGGGWHTGDRSRPGPAQPHPPTRRPTSSSP